MANKEHLAILEQGVEAWNAWLSDLPDTFVADLAGAPLQGKDLTGIDLRRAYLREAKLDHATPRRAILWKADLHRARLRCADLREANLRKANLFEATLSHADLRGANLTGAMLVDTRLRKTDLRGCYVFGCSVWDAKLWGASQSDLVLVDAPGRADWRSRTLPQVGLTTDDLEVAQFIYLLLHNQKIRHVIDTITSKVVLILGRFTEERKAVLDAIREDLRNRK